VFVKGAAGDVILEIEFIDIIPARAFGSHARSRPPAARWPGHSGALAAKDNWATSAQLPGVRIPGARSWACPP
jgi:hypothetical protein